MGGGHDDAAPAAPPHRVGPHDGGFADLDHLLQRSGPLVAKESVACGTPVASVNVGDVARWLPEACIAADRSPIALADACERVLSTDWGEQPVLLPDWCQRPAVARAWEHLLRSA